jgi:hypothetical protein
MIVNLVHGRTAESEGRAFLKGSLYPNGLIMNLYANITEKTVGQKPLILEDYLYFCGIEDYFFVKISTHGKTQLSN